MRTIAHPARAPGRALIVYCAGIFSLLALASDLYLPALPAIRTALGATDALAQLTLSAFAIGFGTAQLAYGPMSDRFGRRPVLLTGLALFMLGSIAAVLAPSIEMLVGARFFQGIGACSGPVIGRAIVRDVFDPVRGARALAQIMMLVVLVPMFAPLFGGYLTVWVGWRATFGLMLVCGLVLWIATWSLLAESSRHFDATATNFLQLLRNARTIYTNHTFFAYAVCFTVTYAGLFFFLSASAFVLIEVLHVRPQDFGLWFIIPVAGNFIGSFVCSRLTRRFALAALLGAGAGCTATGGLLMLALAAAGVAHPLAIFGPMMLYLFGHAFINPVCLAAAVAPFPKIAGTASALLGCTQLVVAAVVGQLFMRRFFDGAPIQLAAAVAFAGCLVLGGYVLLIRPLRKA
ncbi:MAG TPA: multidrug effflux MFS transporter [Burkholderiales bacterium]|nr:multidrug effflux MFS transporter [Burkholderiales bacterium]